MAAEGEHKVRIGAVLGGRYRLERVLGLLLELTGKEEALRFAREALTVSTLSHPNITRIVESGVDTASGSPCPVQNAVMPSGRGEFESRPT